MLFITPRLLIGLGGYLQEATWIRDKPIIFHRKEIFVDGVQNAPAELSKAIENTNDQLKKLLNGRN